MLFRSKHSLTNGSVFLIIGSLIIGYIATAKQAEGIKPFTTDIYKGFLAIFLLDMGLMAAKNFNGLKGKPSITLFYAILAPLVHASLALGLCKLLGLPLGETILLMVLAASASYIAVPAALKLAIPEASPTLYLGLSLGLTFPMNIILGIPVYFHFAQMMRV